MRLAAWFDPRGRISREAYARSLANLLLLSAALLCLAVVFGKHGLRPASIAAAAGIGLLWLAVLARTVRRLHDRGRTGWWLALFLLLAAPSFAPVESLADAHPVGVLLYTLAALAVSLWLPVETLGRRGTVGPNRYGPAPADLGGNAGSARPRADHSSRGEE